MLCSGPESHTKAQPDAGGISIEEQIAAVQSALHWRDSVGLAINKDSETGRENEARIAALRAALATLEAQRWRPIEEAPKDGATQLLLFGEQEDRPRDMVHMKGARVFSGYWDAIDEAWCSTGSTWAGPFYNPTHWRPLPDPPEPQR